MNLLRKQNASRHCYTFEIWRLVGDFLNFAKLFPQMTTLDLRLCKETIVLPLSSFVKIGSPSGTDFIYPTIILCAKFTPMETKFGWTEVSNKSSSYDHNGKHICLIQYIRSLGVVLLTKLKVSYRSSCIVASEQNEFFTHR